MKKGHKLFSVFVAGSLLMVSLIVLPFFTNETDAQNRINMEKAIQKMSDTELVCALGSRDREESYQVAKEIMLRGDRMIPLLIANKGKREPYVWGNLGIQDSSFITLLPSGNDEWDDGRIITVEVASIYLISALFNQKLEFAYTTYLRDKEEVSFSKYNTPERVQKAWTSVENWLNRLNAEGLQSLRERKIDPLAESGFYF